MQAVANKFPNGAKCKINFWWEHGDGTDHSTKPSVGPKDTKINFKKLSQKLYQFLLLCKGLYDSGICIFKIAKFIGRVKNVS